MKKIIILLICLLTLLPIYSQTTYTVETNQGTQEVVIPDDMTETDVLLYLATSYYNLYYEKQELEEKVTTLTDQVESYIEKNKELRSQYSSLIGKYDVLSGTYERLYKTTVLKGVFGADVTFKAGLQIDCINLNLGALLFEKVGVTARIGYGLQTTQLTYGLGASIVF